MRYRLIVSVLCVIVAGGSVEAITPNAQEQELAQMIKDHVDQGRSSLTYHPILNLAARFHARDLATRSYFSHTDLDGYGANFRVRQAGYRLPSWWGSDKSGNYIESIAAGYSSVSDVFNGWMNSSGHKRHVLAEESFYADQTYYGVGYYYDPGSAYRHYWVFVSAPPDTVATLSPYIEWQYEHLTMAEMEHTSGDPDGDGVKTLVEYVVNRDPSVAETGPVVSLNYNHESHSGELMFPVRSDLSPDVHVNVQTSTNLNSGWTAEGMERSGDVFSAGQPGEKHRYFRVQVTR